MTTKFYLHRGNSAVTGTLPTTEQSSLTSVNDFEANQATNRAMDTTISASSQTSLANASQADTSTNNYYIARWVSPLLYQASLTAQTWSFEYAASESNAAANFPVTTSAAGRINAYVWKPSDGTKTGTILDGATGTIAEAGTSQTVISGTFTGSAVTGMTPGDAVIIIEHWAITTQGNGTSRTQTVFFDGTTENSTSNEAAFVSTPENLVFTEQSDRMTIIGSGATSGTTTANTDAFFSIVGVTDSITTTENNVKVRIREAGTLSNLGVSVTTNGIAGASTFTVMKGGVASSIVATTTASVTGYYEDITNTLAVAAGDDIDIKFHPGAAAGTLVVRAITLHFTATDTTKTTCILGCTNNAADITSASATRFINLHGRLNTTGTEVNTKTRQKNIGTYKNFYIYVSANARTTDTTFKSYKNGSPGNITVTYTSGQTGVKEDTTHSDTVADGDDYYFACVTSTGTEAIRPETMNIQFDSEFYNGILVSGHPTAITFNANVTNYTPIGGGIVGAVTATADHIHRVRTQLLTLSNLFVYVPANTVTADSTATLMVNGVASALVATLTNNTAGLYSDTSHSVDVGSNDTIIMKIATGATGTSLTISDIMIAYRVKQADFSRSISDTSISVSETIDRVYAASRSISDTSISVSDAIARAATNSRSISESSISVSDAVVSVKGYPRDIAEPSISVSDTAVRAVVNSRAINESSISVSDSIARVIAFSRSLTDAAISVSDALAKVLALARPIAEPSISVSDSIDRVYAANRSLNESSISVSDSAVRAITNSRALNESSISVSDSIDRVYNANRSLSEPSISVSDSAVRSVVNSRAINEASISVSDSVARLIAFSCSISDTAISVSDAIVRAVTNSRTLDETVMVSDDIDAIVESVGNFARNLDETVDVSDQLDRTVTNSRSLAEPSISVSDSVTKTAAFSRALNEASISVSDSLTRSLSLFRPISDAAISVSDQITKLYNSVKSLSDPSISVSDTLTRDATNSRDLADSVSVSDTLTKVYSTVRNIVDDAIAVSDSVDILQTFGIPTLVRKVRTWLFTKYEEDDPAKE